MTRCKAGRYVLDGRKKVEDVLILEKEDDWLKYLTKLHRQFAHIPNLKLPRHSDRSGASDTNDQV